MKRSQFSLVAGVAVLLLWSWFGARFGHAIDRDGELIVGLSVAALSVWAMIDWWNGFETGKGA